MEPRNEPQQADQNESLTSERHDIFQDPALNQTLQDDPFVLFIKKWWVHIVMVAGAVVLGVYAKGVFEETSRAELMRAADIFFELESMVQELPAQEAALAKARSEEAPAGATTEDAKKKTAAAQAALDQTKARVESSLKSLEDTREPYISLARVYRGALAAQDGNVQLAQQNLSLQRWQAVSEPRSTERFIAELEALILARSLLDTADRSAEGRGALRTLAEGGEYFSIPAAIAFISIAQSAEEKAEAKALVDVLKSKAPEQSELLNSALKREM